MIILLACAKIMTGRCPRPLPFATEPVFQQQANENAVQITSFSAPYLKDVLKVNQTIAEENWRRYKRFFDVNPPRQPAAFAYDGMVFRQLAPETFSDDELRYANRHLAIASFLYGLLRPLDLVKPYRLEGDIILPENGGKTLFNFWKPLLTERFIEQIKADGGTLVNLASNEMRGLFDWKRIEREVRVVTPEFRVQKAGKLKTIVIYTKMCRGAMARHILLNRLTQPADLKTFEYEGFKLDERLGEFQFVLDA